jgi:hypothetical protein
MIRAPKHLLSLDDIDPFLHELDWVEIRNFEDSIVIDIVREEVEPGDGWDDGSGCLATLAPLRADVLAGDLRVFYLLWLVAVQDELVRDDEVEPLPGIGPLTGALERFVEFLGLDSDLALAAAERGAEITAVSKEHSREVLAAMPDSEKIELLVRVAGGDAHVAAEIKNRLRKKLPQTVAHRTVGTLRTRAQEIATARERAAAERREVERRRQVEETAKARRARLATLKQRGEAVWGEVEAEVERRNGPSYDRAATLLADLQALAVEQQSHADFRGRLASIRARHQQKPAFIERLKGLATVTGHEDGSAVP